MLKVTYKFFFYYHWWPFLLHAQTLQMWSTWNVFLMYCMSGVFNKCQLRSQCSVNVVSIDDWWRVPYPYLHVHAWPFQRDIFYTVIVRCVPQIPCSVCLNISLCLQNLFSCSTVSYWMLKLHGHWRHAPRQQRAFVCSWS